MWLFDRVCSLMKFLMPALVIATATGCGFRLQGDVDLPAVMDVTYIQTIDQYSQFYRAMNRRLLQSGARVTGNAVEATATLIIDADVTGQRVLSVSAENVPQEYEVYYTLEYSVRAKGRELLSSQVITLTRNYTYDTRDVLGKAQEEQELRKSLVEDLVRLVSLKLGSLEGA